MVHLRIFHMNDLHSRFEKMSKFSTILKEYAIKNSLIFDAGDHADFMRMETEGTSGEISSALLNYIKCTARVFGNNEGFAGINNIKRMVQSSTVPILTCNLYTYTMEKIPNIQDSIIIEIEGLKVLIIGVTAPYNEFYHLFKLHTVEPHLEIDRVLKKIPNSTYDLIVLLSHLGLNQDKEVASKFPQINLIIGGHTHNELHEPVHVNRTYICQAGGFGNYIGMLDLEIVKNNERYKISTVQGKLLSTEDNEDDPHINQIIQDYTDKAITNMSIAVLNLSVNLEHSLIQENSFSNFLADALYDIFEVDFGLIHSGILNNSLSKGPVSKMDILNTSPSPLNPTYMEIQGKSILTALEQSLLKKFQLMDGKGAGFRGKYLGNLAVSSNVKVTYKPLNPSHNKIIEVRINGALLKEDYWYKVCTSDYLQRGTGYKSLSANKNEKYDPMLMKNVLEKYLSCQTITEKAKSNRFISKN